MIPVNEPLVGSAETEYVLEALKTGWISSEGKYIRAFEELFAQKCGRKHGIAVNNGTSALIAALRALRLPAGSEVILPSFTIISCALACIYNNLVPVFVDSDARTWNMNPDQVEACITPKTKAVMAVHIYGLPAEMAKIEEICTRNNLILVEDFAEAIGSVYRGRKCGSFGTLSCASFYANKVITTGEGGMVLTDDDELAARLRSVRNLCFLPERRFVHEELGYNFRMTNIQAAIGLGQTERLEEHVEKKIRMGELYNRLLAPLMERGLLQLPPVQPGLINTYWMYGLVLKGPLSAAECMKRLGEAGIGTRPFFFPLHAQPAFEQFSWHKKQSLPVSENLYRMGFYLPSGLTLTDAQIQESAEKLTLVLSAA